MTQRPPELGRPFHVTASRYRNKAFRRGRPDSNPEIKRSPSHVHHKAGAQYPGRGERDSVSVTRPGRAVLVTQVAPCCRSGPFCTDSYSGCV
jgi:hypothetical protein